MYIYLNILCFVEHKITSRNSYNYFLQKIYFFGLKIVSLGNLRLKNAHSGNVLLKLKFFKKNLQYYFKVKYIFNK